MSLIVTRSIDCMVRSGLNIGMYSSDKPGRALLSVNIIVVDSAAHLLELAVQPVESC